MNSTPGMMALRLGRTVQEERGYAITEVLVTDPARDDVTGFALVGPLASMSIIYASRREALEALHDIEERVARGRHDGGEMGRVDAA